MAPKFCCNCSKKATRTRTIDPTTAVCNECLANNNMASGGDEAPGTGDDYSTISDDTVLSDIRFGDLKNWFRHELRSNVKQIVKEELKTELDAVRKTVKDVTAVANQNKQSIGANVKKIDSITDKFNTLDKDHKEVEAMSKNNLKYLINLDRNERRQNVIFFGVPEDELTIGNVTADTDLKKCNALFQVMNVEEVCRVAVKEVFRLGVIPEGDTEKRRPLKVKFTSSKPASDVLKAGKELKNLEGENIYVKPDKTKGEQDEFKRIGNRKTELLAEYSDDTERVKLSKGVLYVDGIEVDRYKSVQTLF